MKLVLLEYEIMNTMVTTNS